jgi:hypothetical protein
MMLLTVQYNPNLWGSPHYQVDCGVRRSTEADKLEVFVSSHAKDADGACVLYDASIVLQKLCSALGSDAVVTSVTDLNELTGGRYNVWTSMRMGVLDTKEKVRVRFFECIRALDDAYQDMR